MTPSHYLQATHSPKSHNVTWKGTVRMQCHFYSLMPATDPGSYQLCSMLPTGWLVAVWGPRSQISCPNPPTVTALSLCEAQSDTADWTSSQSWPHNTCCSLKRGGCRNVSSIVSTDWYPKFSIHSISPRGENQNHPVTRPIRMQKGAIYLADRKAVPLLYVLHDEFLADGNSWQLRIQMEQRQSYLWLHKHWIPHHRQ